MKISVALITFNQELYIAECLNSVLSQITDFDFEIVIGDDFSSDKTREIILDFKQRFPGKIVLLENDGNVGMNKNFIRTINACRGEFIAFIEGDDYWTDNNKLQIQSKFLDKNKTYSFCFHLVERIKKEGSVEVIPELEKRHDLQITDFLEKNFLGSCSICFRRDSLKEWPEWFHEVGIMDWLLYILLLKNGNAGYIDKIMGVYRVHDKGVNSGAPEIINLKNL